MRIAREIAAPPSSLILMSVSVVIYFSIAARFFQPRSIYFLDPKPQFERRKLWGKSSNCKSMFSLLDGDETSTHGIPIEIGRIIDGMKRDLRNNDVWDLNYYEKISQFLPSVINKKIRAFESAPFNDTLMHRECGELLHVFNINKVENVTYEEVSMAKLCMLWKQKNFTYQLNPKRNILELHNGKLPYLNCRMKDKYSPEETLRCFRNAVHKKNASVLIEFIGDSKINQVFEAFLVETKEIDYEILITGKDRCSKKCSLRDWLVYAVGRHNRRTIEVTVRSAPGITIRMRFAGFYELTVGEILKSDIYKKLLSWALGEVPPPDLIIIGYGTWMMLLEFLRNDFRPPLTLLHNLWDIHAAVLRMLLNMKDTTRVLFISQNIPKPHAYKEKKPAFVEKLSRTPWVHFSDLGWLNLREELTRFHAPYAGGNKTDFWRAVFARRSNAFSFLPKSISFRDRFRILTEELPSVSKESHRSQQKSASHPEGHAEIWFWDSSQPLTFASLRDCDTLFHHDPMSSYLILYAYNIDPMPTHTYAYGLLRKLDFPPEEFFKLHNQLSDEVRPPTADFIFKIRPNAEAYNNSFFRQMKTHPENVFANHTGSSFEPGNLYLNQLNEYYDTFATAYAMPDLHCRDPRHGGYLVKQVEAMQILNMICNQFMDLNDSFCCYN